MSSAVGYVIDPRVQGSISLSSGRPVEKKDMLYVLENALSANNLVMVRNPSGYRIGPANEGGVGAVDEARGSQSAEPGFGLTVIPLQYVPERRCRSCSKASLRALAPFEPIRAANC